MPNLRALALMTGLIATPIDSRAETAFDYSLRIGHSSNLFEDANALKGAVVEAEAKLRGGMDFEGSSLSYELSQREKRLGDYRFADEHETGLVLRDGLRIADTVDVKLEAGLSRKVYGDVLLAVPGTVIGYRSADLTYHAAASAAADFLGGTNKLTAGISRLDRGKAHFTTDLLLPSKIEADVTAFELTANHIRPALSGELGFTLAYRATMIPASDQIALLRLPASTLRGSIAYGRKIGQDITVIAELGATSIMGEQMGANVRTLRPYVHGSIEWTPTEKLTFGLGYDQDYAITGIDDARGEFIRTWKIAAGARLAPRVDAKLAYEITSSDWIYYLYDTRTRRFTGTLGFDLGKGHRLELEYRDVRRTESDQAQNFKGQGYFAKLNGTF